MGEALKNVTCPSCGDPPFGEEERRRTLQQLRIENEKLKEEHARLSSILAAISGKPVRQIHQALSPSLGYSMNHLTENFLGQGNRIPSLDPDLVMRNSKAATLGYQFNGVQETDRLLMIEIATSALDELLELLRVNEPVWTKSPTDGRHVLHLDSYDKLFPKANHLKSSSAQIESSKDSVVVPMNALELVEMLLHPTDWVDLFPTIVTKAKTMEILDTEHLGGVLHLMYKQLHILSPLVVPREFFFLRYCQQFDTGSWVLVDVSYDCHKEIQGTPPPTRCWRLPSGCMIQNLPNGKSKVTWVEHVEVDDKTLTHRPYRDLVCVCQAYGAKTWLTTLQRICERIAYSRGLITTQPSHELEGVINVPEGRRSIMKLADRMVKNFCAILSMSDKLDFPHLSEMNNSGVRLSVRKSTEPGQPQGTIVSAATSFWLPLSCQTLFNFFKDEQTRSQWDVLSKGNPANEIAHISCGAHPGNCVSVIQPFIPHENSMLVLQESCIDPLGALVVYAPIELQAISAAINGQVPANIAILPSGFTISGDGSQIHDNGSNVGASSSSGSTKKPQPGSLVTVAFQVLVCNNALTNQINMESVAAVNTLITSTVQRIKAAFGLADFE